MMLLCLVVYAQIMYQRITIGNGRKHSADDVVAIQSLGDIDSCIYQTVVFVHLNVEIRLFCDSHRNIQDLR